MKTLALLLLSLAACGGSSFDSSAALAGVVDGDSGNLDAGFVDAVTNAGEKAEASAPSLESDAGIQTSTAADAGDSGAPADAAIALDSGDAGRVCVISYYGGCVTLGNFAPSPPSDCGGAMAICCCPAP